MEKKKSLRTISATLTFMAIAVLAFAVTACSNDDEPKAISGEEMLENINQIFAEQSNAGNFYRKSDDFTNLILVADNKEAAHKLCEKFISDKWDGKQRTVKLPDNCGTIALTPGMDESVFYNLTFTALKGFNEQDMTVTIAPKEFLSGDNLAIDQYFPARWTEKCPNCGHKWKTFAPGPYKCSKCGHEFD